MASQIAHGFDGEDLARVGSSCPEYFIAGVVASF